MSSEADQVQEQELAAQEWYERGNNYLFNSKYDDAVHCYAEAFRIKPDFADAHTSLGFVYQAIG